MMLGLGVWSISLLVGVLATILIVFVLFDTSLERYGNVYALLTAVSIMFLVLIPLDYFLGTGILPD
ncbi:MAG: hypothetical protein GYB66_12390 [Chloroflexi bacterium]|nr:hypothetical protein [Chloroflexota bacterium]